MSARAQRIDFRKIARAVRLVHVLEHYHVLGNMKRMGRQLKGCCPIHKGSNPKQFVVDPDKDLWRCFSPEHDSGGSTLEFVAELEGVSVAEAARCIADMFGIATGDTLQLKQRRQSMSVGQRPTHAVYSVQKREGKKDWRTRIGSAWPFETDNATGLSIQLTALPIGERMVLFEANDAEMQEEEEPEKPKRSSKAKA